MWLVFAAVSFLFFFAFDRNKAQAGPAAGNLIAIPGVALLGVSTAVCVGKAGLRSADIWLVLLAGLFLLSIALLLYCLFFALPGSQTYGKTGKSPLVQSGVYALCRHPGVWCLAGAYLCLFGLFPSGETAWLTIVVNGCNLIYVCWQDRFLFPRCMDGYEAYRLQTPFLIPNGRSIRTCWRGLTHRE